MYGDYCLSWKCFSTISPPCRAFSPKSLSAYKEGRPFQVLFGCWGEADSFNVNTCLILKFRGWWLRTRPLGKYSGYAIQWCSYIIQKTLYLRFSHSLQKSRAHAHHGVQSLLFLRSKGSSRRRCHSFNLWTKHISHDSDGYTVILLQLCMIFASRPDAWWASLFGHALT